VPPALPDVLLVVLDTVPARSTSLHGYALDTTPNLEKLAAAGAWFRSAIAPSPWTVPSHAALFTGELPREVGCHHENPALPGEPATLAERLSAAGYRTGAFVANPWVGRFNGLTRGFAYQEAMWEIQRSLRSFAALQLLGRLFPPTVGKGAPALIRRTLDWWDSAGDEPSFVFLNLMEAHSPFHQVPGAARYDVEDPHTVGERTQIAQARGPDSIDYPRPGEAEAARRLQAAGIRYLDEQIGALIEALRERGRLAHSVVAVTSDHGEAFGEHGFHGHMVGLYEETLHVPLVLHYPPAIAAGTVIADPAPLRMLPETLLALAGVPGFEASLLAPEARASGNGLLISEQMRPVQVFSDHSNASPQHLSSLDHRALRVRSGDLVLLRETPSDGGVPRWHFFDLAVDPGETQNLWPDPRAAPLRARMEAHDQIPLGDASQPSTTADLRDQLRALGYLGSP
jgi:arylsulfatase A-like enzyme